MNFWRLPLPITALLLSSAPLSAQTTPAVVNSPTSPVKVVSVTANLNDFLHEVRVRNQSGKQVSALQFGLVMGIPEGCGPSRFIGTEEKLRMDHVDFDSSTEMFLSDYMLYPGKFISFRNSFLGQDVYSQLAVVFVKFSDGSEWRLDHQSGMYRTDWFDSYANYHCSVKASPTLPGVTKKHVSYESQ